MAPRQSTGKLIASWNLSGQFIRLSDAAFPSNHALPQLSSRRDTIPEIQLPQELAINTAREHNVPSIRRRDNDENLHFIHKDLVVDERPSEDRIAHRKSPWEKKAPPARLTRRSILSAAYLSSTFTTRKRFIGETLQISHTRRAVSSQARACLTEELPQRDTQIDLSEVTAKTEAEILEPSSGPKIRQRLRQWEIENVDSVTPAVVYDGGDRSKDGAIDNIFTRPGDPDDFSYGSDQETGFEDHQIFDPEDLVDLGNNRTFLLRGDMVEIRGHLGLRSELAIFVRELDTQAQFYTMSGKWLHRKSHASTFFVPNFVEAHELDDIIRYLPAADVPSIQQDRLQSFENALPRNVGRPLVQKMLDFWKASDDAYRVAARKLDNAHSYVAKDQHMRHATLPELAEELLPATMKNSEGQFPTPLLFALHRSLLQNDIGFRPQRYGFHRTWGRFEISSKRELAAVRFVSDAVRRVQQRSIMSQKANTPEINASPFHLFVSKAKKLISRSRELRDPTPYGVLGPTKSSAADHEILEAHFTDSDMPFLDFMESWSGIRTIGRHSPLNGAGSAILRATGMYEGYELDGTTAWTFLQEIGVYPPWSNRAALEARLPGTGRHQGTFQLHTGSKSLKPDSMEAIRLKPGNCPVYCIDDVSAQEIDDGVSVEATENPEEYWVHVHVANPTSEFDPDSVLGKRTASLVSSSYFPDRVTGMLPSELVKEKFTLATGRPCLTFSALLNQQGDILDQKIVPGTVGEVVFMTPFQLNKVLGIKKDVNETVIQVGSPIRPPTQDLDRHIISELLERHLEDLELLRVLTRAHRDKLARRGAVQLLHTGTEVTVDLGNGIDANSNPGRGTTSSLYHSDPSISVTLSVSAGDRVAMMHDDPVMTLMLLAGEVAARWCSDRGIPIIYRVHQKRPDKPDPEVYFREKMLPYVLEDKPVPPEISSQYLTNLATVLPSSTPGPQVALGMDMYTKCTSPLRRYADMVTHWQIEGALLEEARLGRSLVGNTKEDFLPFTKSAIDKLIPHLDTRERELRVANNASERSWFMYLLLRAWKFGQASLPATFNFITRSVKPAAINGEMNTLGSSPAFFVVPPWLKGQEVNVGDAFEVEFESLNIYTRRVEVTPLRRVYNKEV